MIKLSTYKDMGSRPACADGCVCVFLKGFYKVKCYKFSQNRKQIQNGAVTEGKRD